MVSNLIADLVSVGPDAVIFPTIIAAGIIAVIAIIVYILLRKIRAKNAHK